jgi:hypothetical protein
MKKMEKILVITIILVSIGLSGCVGGPCSYETYKGIATVISVKPVEIVTNEVTYDFDQYQVLFIFSLNENESIKEDQIALFETISGKKQEFKLTNSWYPNQEYLVKYDIYENQTFECELMLISEGTCSPWIFKLKGINYTDYSTFDLDEN